MNKAFILCFLLFVGFNMHSQTENGAFTAAGSGIATPFVTDYQSLGINPANLNLPLQFEGKRFAMGYMEGGFSLFSEFFSKEQLKANLYQRDLSTLTRDEKIDLAQQFANAPLILDMDMTTFGFGLNTDLAGGFAFSTRERIDLNTEFGSQVADLLFLGSTAPYFEELVLSNGDTIPNSSNLSEDTLEMVVQGIIALENAQSVSELLEGTQIGMSWVREFNLGYGKRLLNGENLKVFAGIGIKGFVGNALMNVNVQNGETVAFAAFSPVFDIDYGDVEAQNPSSLGNAPGLKPVGHGWGIDLGATVLFKDKLTLSASVVDIGQMTWDGNVYELNDFAFTEYNDDGVETLNFVDQIFDLASPDSFFKWQGAESITTKLPTTMRLGAGLKINEMLRVGTDLVFPLNDAVVNYDQGILAIGGEFRPLPFLILSAGVQQGGGYGTKIPAGIIFQVGDGTWTAGVSSRDMVTYFSDNDPMISASWGFLRFRF